MAGWEDEPLGTFGSGAQVPTGQWFGVDTSTGAWQLPGAQPDTIAANVSSVPSPGQPDQAPLSMGQVAGGAGFAPQLGPQPAMHRLARLDQAGGLTPQPGMWESIARGVGMASPIGRSYLQSADQQQQQQLQNRLTMRRQMLQEEQNERSEIRDDFNSLLKLSEIKSKKLRQLYTDRFVADMQARGKTLPPDFVEAFKTSTGDEAKAMVKFYEPLLTDLGLDPTAFAELVDQGGIKEVGEALTLAQKLKKDKTEQARLAALDRVADGTLGDASGAASPAQAGTPAAPPLPSAPGTRQPAAALPPEYTTAIDEAHKRYPQVRKELIPAIIAGESNFDAKAVSPKGAQGLMQLMPAAQKDMGVTDPFDTTQNVRGGTGYYAKMLERYKGNEALALAAYNWGPGNVDTVKGDLSKMPDTVQTYVKTTLQRASAGGGTAPDTRMQVAGPGAPAPSAGTQQEQQALTRLNQAIAAKDRQIEAYTRLGGEEANRRADNVAKQRDVLQKQHDRLEDQQIRQRERAEETPRAVARTTAETQAKQDLERQRQGQPMLPEDRRKLLTGLRSDIRQEPTFKIYQDVRNGYQNVEIGAKRDSSEGDLALIYGLAKILDPGSVVRESEFATVAAAQGKLQQLLNTPQRFFEGDRLTPDNRKKLLDMAHALATEKLTTAQKELSAVYEPLAKEGNIAFGQLLPLPDIKPLAAPPSAGPGLSVPKEKLLEKYTR